MTQPVITAKNAADFVESYFDTKRPTDFYSDFTRYSINLHARGWQHGLPGESLYNIFWAIRYTDNNKGKYDYDDIEMQARINPIFAEINTEDDEEADQDDEKRDTDRPTHANQVGLLRKAIDEYRRHHQQPREA